MGFEGTYVGVSRPGDAAAGPAMPHEAVYVLPLPRLVDGADPALAQMIRRILPTYLVHAVLRRYQSSRSRYEFGQVAHALSSALETLLDRCEGSVGELEDRLLEGQLIMQAL